MNLRQQIRTTSELDSRRVAIGTHCIIICEKNTITRGMLTMIESQAELASIAIDLVDLNRATGYSAPNSTALVIPKHSTDELESVMHEYRELRSGLLKNDLGAKADAEKTTVKDVADHQIVLTRIRIDITRLVVPFITDNCFIVEVHPDAKLGIPDGDKHEVVIGSQEVSPPTATLASPGYIKGTVKSWRASINKDKNKGK